MADYGADKMGYPVGSIEALRRAQRFGRRSPMGPVENKDEPGMGFTAREYEEAIAENALLDSARRRQAQ